MARRTPARPGGVLDRVRRSGGRLLPGQPGVLPARARRHAPEYALVLGLPSIGGLAGSWVTRHGAERLGLDRTLRLASWARSAPYILYPLLIGGTPGVVLTAVLFAATLFTTSLANSSMGAIRVRATPGTHQARAAARWSFTGMAAGPVLIAATIPALQAFSVPGPSSAASGWPSRSPRSSCYAPRALRGEGHLLTPGQAAGPQRATKTALQPWNSLRPG